MDTQQFARALPKVELHAHLTGSISRQALHAVWSRKATANLLGDDPETLNPLTAIPPAAKGVDIKTFFPIFDKVIYNLLTTADDISSTTLAVLDAFAADGVVYLELRTTPRANAGLSRAEYVATVLDAVKRHNASQQRLRTRVLLSIDRRMTPEDAEEVVDLALLHRDLIVGVDIAGNPLVGDVRVFNAAVARAREAGLGVTVHFGETASSGREEEGWALLYIQPNRLGHVIHLAPAVREEVLRRRLGLELCLSCNVLAEMTEGGFKGHHFGEWRGSGCPVALSTDDVGIFESELSHEYEMVMEHFGVTKAEAIQLSRQAASIIFGGEEEKERIFGLLEAFEKEHS